MNALPEHKTSAHLTPSKAAMVPFVSVENMMRLVHHIGMQDTLKGIAAYIEDDFKRWESFDKTPRLGQPHRRRGDGIDADL